MNKLIANFKNNTFKYGVIFIFTGILILIYSKILFNNIENVENVDIGNRFSSPNFYESDLFTVISLIQIFVGIIYILIDLKASFYLIDKATIRSYWFTNSFILVLLITPLLDKFFPTNEYQNYYLNMIIMTYIFISVFLFFIGIFYYFYNLIKALYSYFLIKKGWK